MYYEFLVMHLFINNNTVNVGKYYYYHIKTRHNTYLLINLIYIVILTTENSS